MLNGIDVSKHNGVIDWAKVKKAGYNFAMIRAGYGLTKDARFDYNAKEALKNGITIGAYWFSYAYTVSGAKKEAQKMLEVVKPYKITYPLAYDFEYDSVRYAKQKGVTITKALASNMADAFLSTIKAAGYYPANYTNFDYLMNYFTKEVTNKYDLWLAAWRTNKTKPTGYPTLTIWQHDVLGTSEHIKRGEAHAIGSVAGINGAVDINYCYKSYGSHKAPETLSEYFPKCSYTGVSLVQALISVKANYSFNYRKKIASKNGIDNYNGTAQQNTLLLNKLKQGKLLKP